MSELPAPQFAGDTPYPSSVRALTVTRHPEVWEIIDAPDEIEVTLELLISDRTGFITCEFQAPFGTLINFHPSSGLPVSYTVTGFDLERGVLLCRNVTEWARKWGSSGA